MSNTEEEFVSLAGFPASAATTAVATTLGYQVLSIVGNRVRDVLSTALSNVTEPSQTVDNKSSSLLGANVERRPSRKSASGIEVSDEDLPIYSLKEISFHDMPEDCWMTIYDRVYDLTSFISEHPGGDEVMMEYAGRDATIAFRGVGHSSQAENAMKPYLIGILPAHQRIWTRFSNMNADKPT